MSCAPVKPVLSFDMQNSTEDHGEKNKRDQFTKILVISLILTVIFHVLPANGFYGLAFFVFAMSLSYGITYIARLEGPMKNKWAYWFLAPVVISSVANLLYAGSVVRGLSLLIVFVSLVFYAYWACNAPIGFSDLVTFWPFKLFKDTIWPFGSLGRALSRFKHDHRLGSVFLGLFIALPFVLLFFVVFVSADVVFANYFKHVFNDAQFGEYIFKLIRDFVVLIFFFASGATMLLRQSKDRVHEPQDAVVNPFAQTVYVAFLSSLNILFFVFVIFQLAYFFGGQDYVLSQGLTYADYARHGFFELLLASGMVLAIVSAIYYLSGLKLRLTRFFTLALIVQTGIIIVSALHRLFIYVMVYGLSVQRWWAAFCIILIAVVLLMVFVAGLKQYVYHLTAKVIFIAVLLVSSSALLVNSEALVARYNIDRFLSGQTNVFDPDYLNRLSEDAIPEIAPLVQTPWPTADFAEHSVVWELQREYYYKLLLSKKEAVNEKIRKNWRTLSLSHIRASAAMDSLKD